MPKAIVHSVGGVLINYYKEGHLHESSDKDSVVLQYTTTGWIMYLSAVGALIFGGRAVLYDGSPFQPDLTVLLRIAEEQKATKLGISPRWMSEIVKNGISPREMADLSSLRIVTSTGMVLSDQLFEWFYDKGFPPSVHLANISGGTDIVGSSSPPLLSKVVIANHLAHLLGWLLRSHEPPNSCLRWWNTRPVSGSPCGHIRCASS
jgi:acetoacetyl-CoA synthetase